MYQRGDPTLREVRMKIMRIALLVLFVCAAAYPQTEQLGEGMYYSGAGDILVGVDVTIAAKKFTSPYVMFMAFMAAKENKSLTLKRADVTMIYKGQEYKMPTLKEIEKAYK